MANIDWTKLTFSYTKTNTILTCTFKDGKWGNVESLDNDNITISSFAGALHYSIECFEGLKAFRGSLRNSSASKRLRQKCSLKCVSAV